jgi:hypothetical protein
MGFKKCTRCLVEKSFESFVKRSNRKHPFQPYCKSCHSSKQSEYDRYDYNRNYDLMKSYGINHDDYLKILKDQNGKCGICGKCSSELTGVKRHLCVDHCHKTNVIRGLLCDKCNRGLGLLGDNIDIIYKAYTYLSKSQ